MRQQKFRKQIQVKQVVRMSGFGVVAMMGMLLVGCTQDKVPTAAKLEDTVATTTVSEVANEETTEYIERVQIEVGDVSTGGRRAVGTGVVYQVSEEGVWIATTAHVLENKAEEEQIWLKVAEDSISLMPLVCEQWHIVQGNDLAFLYLAYADIAKADENIEFVPIEADKAGYDALEAGAAVFACGYSNGESVEYQGVLTENWIYVEDLSQYMMVAECEVKHGMSGGGLYDEAGRFVGMLCGGNEKGELVAVPWHVIEARFEEIDINSHF